ncbi:unnamed protein product [Paramecium octaurelia]|uniref:Uncharacterized protein n=1 Tax=Paramecium octaurelia TaxID=43137 RepID=A0A8S1Y225_PAROT|nr:unnamed protein product [Paramecium octaurelia]
MIKQFQLTLSFRQCGVIRVQHQKIQRNTKMQFSAMIKPFKLIQTAKNIGTIRVMHYII